MEESRKRKRGDEEASEESSGENASDWVSDMAYVTWKDKLQYRDFIGERGFNKWISPFTEIVESKGWHLFYDYKTPGFVDVVKDFYANMVGMKIRQCTLEGNGYPSLDNRLTKLTIFMRGRMCQNSRN